MADVQEAFKSGARLLKGMGAPVLDARNEAAWGGSGGSPSIVLFDPTGWLDMAVVVEGGQLTENDARTPLPPQEHVGAHPMLTEIPE